MSNANTYFQIFTLLFSFFYFNISITTENDFNAPKTHPVHHQDEVKALQDDYSVKESHLNNQTNEAQRVDPLFYIDGQLCQHVRRIFQDKSGDLWFGTNVYGLMRYNGDTLEYFDEKDGPGFGRITGIVEDVNGNVLFGTYGGLTKYDGKSFTSFTVNDGLLDNEIWSLTLDSEGVTWIGTSEGISKFDGEAFTTFTLPQPEFENTSYNISPNRVTSITEDKKGNIWIGTDGFGLYKYNGESFTVYTKKNGLCDNNITHILEAKNGDIWIGTMYGGVSKYDGTSFTNFTQDGVVSGVEVWSIYEDNSGNIWFPAENVGVYRYDQNSFVNFTIEDGLNTNGIQCIFEDKEGRFWLGGWGGLFRYDPSAKQSDGKTIFSVTKNGPWQ